MASEKFSLHDHLRKEHSVSPFQTYLKEIVYGGNDGIVTTFAVVAGFNGANLAALLPSYSFLTVLLFGLANLFADAASMGLGNFLSLRSEKGVYATEQAKELHEIRNHPEMEKEETVAILQTKGFAIKDAQTLAALYAKNEKYWLSFMMNHELEIPNPGNENPFLTAGATFTAFLTLGFIPLVPYVITLDPTKAFVYSIAATFLALVVLGLIRWKFTAESAIRSVIEVVSVGGIAASLAYIVGTFFKL